jgi:hypothetical protein
MAVSRPGRGWLKAGAHMPQIEEMALFNQTLDKFINSEPATA